MFESATFVEQLRGALRESAPQQAVREVLARAMSLPRAELDRAFGVSDRAELGTLHRAFDLTVLKVVWAPGMAIAPHDHNLWAVIGVYGGVEDNRYFRRLPREPGEAGPLLEQAGDRRLEAGAVVPLGEQLIHAVRNPRDIPAATIHVYGGDFFATPRSEWDEDARTVRPSSGERTRELFRRAREELR